MLNIIITPAYLQSVFKIKKRQNQGFMYGLNDYTDNIYFFIREICVIDKIRIQTRC